MTLIEIFAFIVLIALAVKIIMLLISPKAWLKFVEKIWKAPALIMWVSLILALIVLYYLTTEISITQIFAVMLFIALISAVTMAGYAKDFLSMAKKLAGDKNFLKRTWLPILIWIVLAIWAAKELFI